MQEYLFSYLKHFVLSAVLICISYFYFGSFYEEYQGFWNAFFTGALSPGTSFDNFYFLGYIGISHVYAWFLLLFPGVQWFSIFHFLQLNVSFALFFSIAAHLLKGYNIKGITQYAFFSILFFALFLDNIILFVYARASFILCAASYLALIVLFRDFQQVKKHPFVYVSIVLLFLWGDLTRVESAMAASLLLFCFSVLWYHNLKRAILISLPVLLVVGLSLAGIFLDIHYSSQFHKQVEPVIETEYTVRFNVVPVESMQNFEDSVKYEAAMRMFWADPDIITIPYLKSLVKEPDSFCFDTNQWKRVGGELQMGLNNFKFHFTFLLLSTLLILVLLVKYKSPSRAILLFLYFLGLIVLLVFNSYFAKMRDRTISPLILIYLISLLYLLIPYFKYNFRLFKYTLIGLFLWSIANIVISKNKADLLLETRKTNILNLNKVKEYCKGQTLMPNPTSMGNITLAYTPFEAFDFSAFDKFYFYEASIQSIIPPYYQYLNKECSCDVRDFSSFYRFVLDPSYPTEVYTLSNEDRMKMAMVYLKTFHNLDINFTRIEDVDLNENLAMDYYSKRKLYLYQISLKE